MSRLHILSRAGLNVYNVVVHAPTPAGNNLAGVPWATAIQNSGSQVASVLPIGNGAGQISVAESNQVIGGAIIEAAFLWGDDPNWTNQQRLDDLEIRAQQALAEVTASLQSRLKYFGFTVT